MPVLVRPGTVFLSYRGWGGEFSSEQEEEYLKIKASLGDAVPLIEELGLSRPPVLLD